MIIFREHKDIDKVKWDACIESSENANIFVLSWYLDIVCEDWSALILNDYEAVFPLAASVKYKINYLYQPFFTRYFGLYKKNNVLLNTDEFLKAIPDKFKFMEFCIHEKSEIQNKEYEIKERRFQLLDLNLSYEKVREGYADNTKRNIKKAVKKEYIVEKGIKGEEVVNLFKETKGGELEVFKPKDYKILISLMECCQKRNMAQSYAVYDSDQKLVAAAFFMKFKNRYIFLKSGVTDQGKAYGAMHYLIDSFIKESAEQNKILDFGGSSVESVARFYKSFGAKDCVYLQVKNNKLPRLVNWLKSLKS